LDWDFANRARILALQLHTPAFSAGFDPASRQRLDLVGQAFPLDIRKPSVHVYWLSFARAA
jgi:hypothetical protein